jgi:hypothetical protein
MTSLPLYISSLLANTVCFHFKAQLVFPRKLTYMSEVGFYYVCSEAE